MHRSSFVLCILACCGVLLLPSTSVSQPSLIPNNIDKPSLFDKAPQGFTKSERHSTITTVAGVFNNAYDGHLVTLNGRLVEYLGHELYLFSDETGNIKVELDDDHDWSFLKKDELIQIVGVVDNSIFSTKVDVKQAFRLEPRQQMAQDH